MAEDQIQRIGDVRVDLLEVDHPVLVGDAEILGGQPVMEVGLLLLEVRGHHIAPPGQEDQQVAEPVQVEAEHRLTVLVVVVEVNPSRGIAFVVPEDMVAADVAMFFALVMEKLDGAGHLDEHRQHLGEMAMKIFLMVNADQFVDQLIVAASPDNFQDADIIAGLVQNPVAVHEVGVMAHQVEDAGLLAGAAKTVDHQPADPGLEGFVKDQLQNVTVSALQPHGPAHPVLGFVVHAETTLFLVTLDPERFAAEHDHIVIIDPEEVRGVGDDLEAGGNPGRSSVDRHQFA